MLTVRTGPISPRRLLVSGLPKLGFYLEHYYSKVIESPSDPTSLWREGVERIEPKARFFQHLHS